MNLPEAIAAIYRHAPREAADTVLDYVTNLEAVANAARSAAPLLLSDKLRTNLQAALNALDGDH